MGVGVQTYWMGEGVVLFLWGLHKTGLQHKGQTGPHSLLQLLVYLTHEQVSWVFWHTNLVFPQLLCKCTRWKVIWCISRLSHIIYSWFLHDLLHNLTRFYMLYFTLFLYDIYIIFYMSLHYFIHHFHIIFFTWSKGWPKGYKTQQKSRMTDLL